MLAPSTFEQIAPDPILSDFDLPLRATLDPLGFPLRLVTNSMDVIQAAHQAWGPFSQAFDSPPMRLSLGVVDSESSRLPSRSKFRSREHLMSIILDVENFVMCDFNQGQAFGWVTRNVAADHALLRYRLLSAAVLCMAEQQSLAPLHGALVAKNGCGVAFFGESHAGKSTLSYACARAGWNYISDDGIFLVRDRFDRYAIGDPYTVRFRDDAKRLFPELSDRLAVARPNGKMGMEIFTKELALTPALGSTIDQMVFLNRHHTGPAHLRPYPQDKAQSFFEAFVTYGASHVRAAQVRSYERLADVPVWELCYRNVKDAMEILEKLVDRARPVTNTATHSTRQLL